MRGQFVTRHFVNPTFCQEFRNNYAIDTTISHATFCHTTIYHEKNIRKRHFATPLTTICHRQFVTMTICHERRLRHFLTRQFVTMISILATICHALQT